MLASRFVDSGSPAEQIDAQSWDPSVKGLARYPDVLATMNENLDWTNQLGAAVIAQQDDVMQAIQTQRAKANSLGNLTTTPQQQVIVQQDVIQIVPADPQIIYVPQYNPQVVYVEKADPVTPLITFGIGFAMGAWLTNDCDWHHHGFYVNNYHGGWHGYSNNNVNINNNININNGNNYWKPNPNRPRPRPPFNPNRPGGGNGSLPGFRPPPSGGWNGGNRPGQGNRPGTGNGANRPGNGGNNRPGDNGNNGGKPGNSRPTFPKLPGQGGGNGGNGGPGSGSNNRPGGNGPTKPSQPKPSTRPASPQNKPAFGGGNSGMFDRENSKRERPANAQRPTQRPAAAQQRPAQQSRPAAQRPPPQAKPATAQRQAPQRQTPSR